MKKPRLSVIQENDSGRNLVFKDTATGAIMSRAATARKIEQGTYPNYHVRRVNGLKTPASNPNSREWDNLG